MLKLDISKSCHKFLKTLDAKQFRQVVSTILGLAQNPTPHDSCQLVGHPFRRVDSGEYRIIYRIEADTVRVAVVGKRNDSEVFKKL